MLTLNMPIHQNVNYWVLSGKNGK